MQRYIEQLIEDIREAALLAPADPFADNTISDEEALELELDEAERFSTGPFEKLSDIIGISKNLLPAPERLNDEQLQALSTEMINLLIKFNFIPEYPVDVPYKLLYKALLSIWDDDYVLLTTGQSHIEFCDYDEDTCPFPGYCKLCKENNTDDKQITPNEFNIKASDLSGEMQDISGDFDQIEKEFYDDSDITDDEGFVPGIHNYCDRWCERCDFTDKCRSFELEQELKDILSNPDKLDELPEEDSDFLDAAISNEDEMPDIDLIFEDEMDEHLDEESSDFFSAQQKAGRHPMVELAHEYSKASFDWFRKRESELQKYFNLQLAHGFADQLMEAEDIMMWYHLFIYIKLKRAVADYYDIDEFDDMDYDMNGTAKVALIGLDRSIDAATLLMRHLKHHRKDIKLFRNQLEKIREMAEEMFPEARAFIRPGLDEL